MLALLKQLTVNQWELIDREHRSESLPSLKPALVLLTAAIALILPHYLGSPEALTRWEPLWSWLKTQPHPTLYPYLYWALFKLVNYVFVPALCIKLVLKGRIRDFGLGLKHSTKTWALYVGMLALVLPLAYAASFTAPFLRTYPKFAGAGESWTVLLLWELAYGLQFFCLEFFFRGFLLFALARTLGALSIFVMIVPYAMIHFGKPPAECVGSIIAGIALGTVALRTRSIYGGVFVHCGVAFSMDVFALIQKGTFQQLLRS